MAAAAAGQLSIWDVIEQGDLAEVQRRVQADPGVMEEWEEYWQHTPLMWAINKEQPAIALWLIQHRGDHDLDAEDEDGWSAIHYACSLCPLEVVKQLVAAGADVAAATNHRDTALMLAALNDHADVVTFLLTLPAVRDSIDSINTGNWTALSYACANDHTRVVRLLLDAGANPTIPQGDRSPLNQATSNNHQATIALLTAAIAESQCPRLLHKARSVVDASFAIRKAHHDSVGRTRRELRRNIVAAAPEYLKRRVRRGEQLPRVMINEDDDNEERQAVLAYTLGMAYGENGDGLPRELFTELLEMMVPRWDAGARRP